MRSKILLGIMIPILVLMVCLPGSAEELALEEAADSEHPSVERRLRETKPGRTKTPPRPAKAGKEKRPAVPLELPQDMEETRTKGISLDDALQRLLAVNRDLAIKYHEIPKARADILSAGLTENPGIFLDSEGVPYGNYSPQRPGETGYAPTVIFPPLDLSGKRGKRLLVARRAEKVLEAMYQDAVRQEIDKLYSAYVDALEAEVRLGALRRAAAQRWSGRGEKSGAGIVPGTQADGDRTETALRRANTEMALREAEASLLQARRELALLLAVSVGKADGLAVRGSLRDRAPPPPPTDELISLALRTRPDLAAFQLSVDRAQANVQLSRAERWDDILTFYTPYQATTFPSQGLHTAAGWETGGLAVLPVFERNQGDIAGARVNVTQLQLQAQGMRDQVVYEVQHATTGYAVSRQLVQTYENTILPSSRRLRDDALHRFREGPEGFNALLKAEQNYESVNQRYLEALVNHRRAMLRLNTVVGQRLLP